MKAKGRLLLIALAAILITVLTQPTLAYYTTIGKALRRYSAADPRENRRRQRLPGGGRLCHPRRHRFQAGFR